MLAFALKGKRVAELTPLFGAKYGRLWGLLPKLRKPRSQGVRVDLA